MTMKHQGRPMCFRRWRTCITYAALLGLMPSSQALTLHDVIEQTWKLQPEAASRLDREQELDARLNSANAWTPAPPSVSVMHKTDQIGSNSGLREWEAELGVPLWLPGQKKRQQASVEAEKDVLQRSLTTAQLRIAGEVREAFWAARLADNEREVAARKTDEAEQLVRDVERRVAAGDLPKIDANQAQSALQQARNVFLQTELSARRARMHFTSLTSSAELPTEEEPAPAVLPRVIDHPANRALLAIATAARIRLAEIEGTRRDNPELSVALSRERSLREDVYDNALSLRLRLPFASSSLNQSRIQAARAELVEAEARMANESRRLQSERDAATAELQTAHSILELAEKRYRLAAENHVWISKAFRLGELDLLSRLRGENERFDAELAVSRARLEAARAQSRFNQSAGVVP